VTRRVLIVVLLALVVALTPALDGQQPAVQPDQTGMFRQYAPGLLARVNYQSDAEGRWRVAIWDLLVGPGKTSDAVRLPGGAVIEVRGGSGRAIIDGKPREISGGTTFAVDEGSSLALANGSTELALALRVTLIAAGAR
jgi:hypothetical protein